MKKSASGRWLLSCMDENGQSDSLDYYLKGEHANGELDRLSIVALSVSEKDMRRVLYPPEQQAIPVAVVPVE
ncbi:hypothetical protein [Stutzerimonas stutzeri]|uniref:hypothetical protein n=1 Tax=Stutzerimonas stutzeri TaxID=316 RepID=UPI0015E43C42|nr:hypothetical protein [Stutzerimonas stutzeri]MBA1280316.1 hypothetical protein [Stutzerimonas stutzeri]